MKTNKRLLFITFFIVIYILQVIMLYNVDKGVLSLNNRVYTYKGLAITITLISVIFFSGFLYIHVINPLLYHISIEFAIMLIAIVSSAVGIITHVRSHDNLVSRLSIGIIFYAFILYLHNLTYPGRNFLASESLNLSMTLKTIANIILAIAIFLGVLDFKKKISLTLRTIIFGSISIGLVVLAFLNLLPQAIVNNQLSTINLVVELVIISLYIFSIVYLSICPKYPKIVELYLFILSIGLLVISEAFSIAFFISRDITDFISSYILFSAMIFILYITIRINFVKPYNQLYDNLLQENKNEIELKKAISTQLFRLERSQEIGKVGTWELDIQSGTIWASNEAFYIYGKEPASNHLIDLETIQTVVHPEDRLMMDQTINKLINENKDYDVTFSITNFKGEERYIHSTATLEYDNDGVPIKVHGVIQDISTLKTHQEELLYANTHDALTDIYNRRYFMEQRSQLSAKKYLPLSTAILDINGLKIINDSFGHHIGNKVLKTIAQILKQHIKKDHSFVARIGGDEFAVIIPNTSFSEMGQIMTKVIKDINQQEVANIKLSLAYGIGTRDTMDITINDILRTAEDEMYLYKLTSSQSVRNKIIDALLKTLYENDIYSEEHSQRVSKYATQLGKACELSDRLVNDIKTAGLLHDIGKVIIDNAILNKQERLTDDEYRIIKMHPEKGYRIIHSLGDMDKIANNIYEHHEFFNGKGYPRGIKGENISLEARIIGIADAFDAMTSFRKYKKKRDIDDAVKELRRCKGTQFDPDLVEIFIKKVLLM